MARVAVDLIAAAKAALPAVAADLVDAAATPLHQQVHRARVTDLTAKC
jgi:hypothetical protein